jgi:hypothetical protein
MNYIRMGTKNHLDYIDNACSLRRRNVKEIGTIIGIRSSVCTLGRVAIAIVIVVRIFYR